MSHLILFYQVMIASSLQKSLNMLKDVESRLSNALTIQSKGMNEVIIELKDVRGKPRQQSLYQKSGRSVSGKLSGVCNPSTRLKTYESQSKSTTTDQLRAQNKQLKKYIHLLEKINQSLRSQVHKLMKKPQSSTYSIPKDMNVYYDSDHFTLLRNQLESLRKINNVQSHELRHLKEQRYVTLQPKDMYQYVSPAKVREQRSKLLSKTEASIPEYSGYCECDGHWKTRAKSKLEEGSGHKRSKTQNRSGSTIQYNHSVKVGTITKKKKTLK